MTKFTVEIPAPGYWRAVFSNPPLNLLNSTNVLELEELVGRIDASHGRPPRPDSPGQAMNTVESKQVPLGEYP